MKRLLCLLGVLLVGSFSAATAHAQTTCDGTDIEQLSAGSGFVSLHTTQFVGQTFLATCTGLIKAVEVNAGATVSGTLKILAGAGSGGAVLGSTPFSFTVSGWARLDFQSPIPVDEGVVYTFYFEASSGTGSIRHDTNDPYADGTSIPIGGNTDLVFSIDLEPAPEFFVDTGQLLGASNRSGLALADLDGDGDLDIFFANTEDPNGNPDAHDWVYLNDGNGVFSDTGQLLGTGVNTSNVALGDIDGDGDIDAVTAGGDSRIWLNNGAGTFSDGGLLTGFLRDVRLADLDDDGDLDIAGSNGSVWLNDGTGGFTATGQAMADAFSLDVADVNGDGYLDIVSVHPNTSGQVWLNDGSGLFAAGPAFSDGLMRRVALGDLDGDGDLDAFVGQTNGDGDRVFLNDGSGSFAAYGARLGSDDAHSVALADVDGDGDLDALVSYTTTGSILWLNDGNAVFTHSGQILQPGAGGIQLADVDGDGDPDAVVGHYDARIWENVAYAAALNVFSVTTTTDSGPGSLRQALTLANATPNGPGGPDQVLFAITGVGPHTIALASPLPAIEDAVVIDGTSQSGASCGVDIPSRALKIVMDGSGLQGGSGLTFTDGSDGSTVRGLVIHSFAGHGIEISNSHGHTVTCSFIGTDVAGTAAPGNGSNGIQIAASTGNTIGGTTGDAGNLISGNPGDNIHFEPGGDNNLVQGNFVGTDRYGTSIIGSSNVGIGSNQGAGNQIGGTAAGAGNVIAGAGIAGIELAYEAATGNIIEGNLIGTNVHGSASLGNSQGILVQGGAKNNTIGGTTEGSRNVISGNQRGIVISGGAQNVVVGNFIGTNAAGDGPLGNSGEGIVVYAGGTTIGGSSPGEGNVISGNSAGIYVEGAVGTTIAGNLIGTSPDGLAAIPNGMGMSIRFAVATLVGGTTPGARNIISGNTGTGIGLRGGGTQVHGNYIGVNAAGSVALPNEDGITVYDGGGNFIGGVNPGEGNVISGNTADGVALYTGAVSNSILGNSIWQNAGIGIRLYPGANDDQPAPVLTGASYGVGTVTLSGTAAGDAGETLRLEFFATDACDPSGFGEGRSPIGTLDVTADGTGQAVFSHAVSYAGLARVTTATATDSDGNTSPFSSCSLPSIGVPAGHVFDVLAGGFHGPQGLVADQSGNQIVSMTGGGTVVRIAPDGTTTTLVFGLGRPAGLARQGQRLYVADVQGGSIFAIDITSVPFGGINAGSLLPLTTGLNEPAHITIGPGGDLYVSQLGGMTGEKVARIDPGTGSATDYVTFSDLQNVNPEGMAFASNGDLYVALQAPGQVVRVPALGPFPVDGSSLPPAFSGLESPNGLGFGPDGRLYIATRHSVKAVRLDASVPTDFVTGLAGHPFNNLSYDGVLLSVADGAAGRILRVTAPRTQVLGEMPMKYRLHTGLDGIAAGGMDAARAAFAAWEAVPGSNAAFIDDGTTSDPVAAIDGVNKVTVDETFPFPPFVLAIAAKTVVFGSTPGEGTITDADIVINPAFVKNRSYPIGTDQEPGAFDLQSIVTHEVGHVLGLVHSGVGDATMYFVLQPGNEARSLALDDRAWAGYRYPAGPDATGSISGNIADGVVPGAVVAGALVRATNIATSEAVHAYSDENGNYYVPGLPHGDYRVSIAPLAGPLRPAHISTYLQTIANNLTFPPEYWNGVNESADPTIDVPGNVVPVTVNGTIAGIDFITNEDRTSPAIAGVFPRSGATNALVDTDVLVTFSEEIDAGTLALTLSMGGTGVPGSVVIQNAGSLAIFTPGAPLAYGVTYEIRVAAGLKDLSGNSLAPDFVSVFTTQPPDLASPKVEAVSPAAGATDVLTTESVSVVFSEPIDPASVAGGFVFSGGPGFLSLDLNNTVLTFSPDERLPEMTTFTIAVAPTVTDAFGNPLGGSGFASTFTTGIETVAIAAVAPINGAVGISVTTAILADFTAPINPAALSPASFQLLDANVVPVGGSFELLNKNTRVVFRPSQPLAYSSSYTIRLPGGLQDAGAPAFQSSFSTAAASTVPTVSSVSPASAAPGKTVVISGRGFDPVSVLVKFNGTEALVTDATLTSITTIVPKTATSGLLVVSIAGTPAGEVHFDIAEPVVVTDEVISRITSDTGARDGDVTPDGAFAFVTNSGADNVSVIDLIETTLVETIPVGETPLKIAITPDGARAYVTNFKSSTVSVIDTETREVIKEIPVGLNPIGVAVTPDGTRAYVGEYTGKAISIIDIDPTSGTDNHVVARVSTDSGNRDVAVSPDGTLVLATGTHGVVILKIEPGAPGDNTVIARVSSDTGTRSTEISPDGAFGFVTTMDGQILVIDLNPSGNTPFQVIAKTTSDTGAREVTVSPDGSLIFATNFESGNVDVYAFSATLGETSAGVLASTDPITGLVVTLTQVASFSVGLNPEGIVFAPSAGLAVVANSGSGGVSIIRFGVPNPVDRVVALIEELEALIIDGAVNKGHGTALLAHLQNALAKLKMEDSEGAAKRLDSFVKLAQLQMKRNQLDQETGERWVAIALELIDTLRGDAAKNGLADAAEETLPVEYALAQNYPNPFNTSTRIEYDVPSEGRGNRVELRVYDLLGRVVMTLVSADVEPGRHVLTWNGRRDAGDLVASGIYFVEMRAAGYREIRKLVLVR